MQQFVDFFSLTNANVVYVLVGMLCISASSALVGTFALLRKRSLLGDAISHALLPGVCLGYLSAGEKDPLWLMAGAFATGWLAIFLVDYIVRNSKIRQDAAIGIVLTFFFGLGIVLITFIQNNSHGNHAGLDHFLFGQAAAMGKSDLNFLLVVLVAVLGLIVVAYRALVVMSFNQDYAVSIGIQVKRLEFLLTSLTVLAIASGIQALGVILISALIITPAAAARFWTNKLSLMLVAAVTISVVSGISGAYVSYAWANMPTGPWVVVFLSLITLLSISFAPKRGLISRYRLKQKNYEKINDENVLKVIFQLKKNHPDDTFTLVDIVAHRNFDSHVLERSLRRLAHRNLIQQQQNTFSLTSEGVKESFRIARLHRLWEQYLLKRTNTDTDHVHSGAEAIEHIITPEIEAELERELGIEGIPEDDY